MNAAAKEYNNRKLLGYTTKYVRFREDSEEITNSMLVLIFKYLNKFRGESGLSTWLYCILRNQICNHFRMIQRRGMRKNQSQSLINRKDDEMFVLGTIDYNLPEKRFIQRKIWNTQL